jgi:hypothetical protein
MSRSVGEDDLLAWIEGELSSEDEARVTGLLEGDPELRAWAESARKDRDLLCEWGRAGATLAPKDLVEHAVAMAEREALLESENDQSMAFGHTGSFRLFTTSRIAMAAGLMLAVTAGYFALPALQGPTPAPIQSTPDQPAPDRGAGAAIAMESATPEDSTADAIAGQDGRQKAERLFSDDVAAPSIAAGDRVNELQIADAGRTDADAEFRQNAGLRKESDSVNAALPASKATVALEESADELGLIESDPGTTLGTDEQFAFDAKSEESLDEDSPHWIEGETGVLAILSQMDGWSVLDPAEPVPTEFEPMTAIGPEGDEVARRARDAEPASMGLDEANELAIEGMLLITVSSTAAADAAMRIRESGEAQGMEILEVESEDDAELRLLAVISEDEGVEPLINLISGSNVGEMTLQRAESPAPELIELNAIAWWALPIDQWVDEQTSGVQIRVHVAEADVENGAEPVGEPSPDQPLDASSEETSSEEPPDVQLSCC